MNIKELAKALKEITAYIEWESESLTDFHLYGRMFGATPGSNLFTFVLEDALRHHGMTLQQFRKSSSSLL